MTDFSNDPVIRQLARLPPVRPDAIGHARIRRRCHAELSRQTGNGKNDRARLTHGALVEVALAGAFTLAYVSAVVRAAVLMFTTGH